MNKQEEYSAKSSSQLDELSPRQIVAKLDEYIIGQYKAKRAVAIAIRNRIRRRKVKEEFRDEIYPKNIIMIGPTGCGKTEIARRLSKLAKAPFVKVEATKYTEVGYVGRDVESMIRDLVSTSMGLVQKEFREKVKEKAEESTHERILDLLLPSSKNVKREANKRNFSENDLTKISSLGAKVQAGLDTLEEIDQIKSETTKGRRATDAEANENAEKDSAAEQRSLRARASVSAKLKNKELEDRDVEIESSTSNMPTIQVMTGNPNMEDLDMNIQNMLGDIFPKKPKQRFVKIEEARRILMEEELNRLVDGDKVREEAIRRAEQMGIIFIDEIDKICGRNIASSNADISREGVQRDLLPIVEGATVNTRYGTIKTDHILFIATGAFHSSSPSDLIPELQGRFPIRVELEKLTEEDFRKILTGPRNSIVRQTKELLATEDVELEFTSDGIEKLACFAFEVNEKTENIGARRLYTIMENLLDEISFTAPDLKKDEKHIIIDTQFVEKHLDDIVNDKDLSRYIL